MHYIIFDLEATCWPKGEARGTHEIIEIGAVKLGADFEVVSEFSSFVKPTEHLLLSDFCRELTSIQQVDVDDAPVFGVAMDAFWRWASVEDDRPVFLSWGYFDKNQILREGLVRGYRGALLGVLEERHFSLKHEYAALRHMKPCGMAKALQLLGIPLEGVHHRGIDDARNIGKILQRIGHELPFLDTDMIGVS